MFKVTSDSQCVGTWTAAKNVKKRGASLDETGLEIGSCRHAIGQKAVNMYQGELFGYPLYLMKFFMEPKGVQFCFADVICKLCGFAKKHKPVVADNLKPALSIMHAKGHSVECHVILVLIQSGTVLSAMFV